MEQSWEIIFRKVFIKTQIQLKLCTNKSDFQLFQLSIANRIYQEGIYGTHLSKSKHIFCGVQL